MPCGGYHTVAIGTKSIPLVATVILGEARTHSSVRVLIRSVTLESIDNFILLYFVLDPISRYARNHHIPQEMGKQRRKSLMRKISKLFAEQLKS